LGEIAGKLINSEVGMKSLKLFAWIITCAILAGMISNCAGLNADVAPSTKDEDTLPTPDVVTSPAEDGSLTVYQNEELGIQFAFPSDWQGPDVYEYETGFRLEIGTDVVYPYGTSREDQVYTQPDAYYIVIQLDRPTGMDSEPAFEALQGLADGESFATPRSLSIRERALEIGPFSGVEFIATLHGAMHTDWWMNAIRMSSIRSWIRWFWINFPRFNQSRHQKRTPGGFPAWCLVKDLFDI
jgi:hypothetical protein